MHSTAASWIACFWPCRSPAGRSTRQSCSTTGCSSRFRVARLPPDATVDPAAIDENRLLLLEDGHCLKDHALSACNRPELRAEAAIMGTSLHTLVQMVDNGLGVTFVPAMAIDAGILDGTGVDVRPLQSDHGFRSIALAWRRSSPREVEFQMLADTLRQIAATVIQGRATADRTAPSAPVPRACGQPGRLRFRADSATQDRSGRRSSPWSRPRRSRERTSPHCPSRHRLLRLRAAGCSIRRSGRSRVARHFSCLPPRS